jgi:hypothetical protein
MILRHAGDSEGGVITESTESLDDKAMNCVLWRVNR